MFNNSNKVLLETETCTEHDREKFQFFFSTIVFTTKSEIRFWLQQKIGSSYGVVVHRTLEKAPFSELSAG
ncbi:CLUMA_CG006959, isoform A [Clunio marinus]|uniref:CLUMA_CG006959, isoform A n=1 Tax=Clunio marinus TaxID=568069 RepID=A0A1J1HZ89_9DIPT|nr:CLUMA_CG006959, isoform A [Clunio marinus]